MIDALKSIQINCNIGIARGVVYSGICGNKIRNEYTVLGDKVNLAARLMTANINNISILCDLETYEKTKSNFEYEILEPIKLKGKEGLIPIFKPKVLSSNFQCFVKVRLKSY